LKTIRRPSEVREVTHERIADEATRDQHRRGWEGCLDGPVRNVQR
jgi:hypothetical protein